MVRRGLTVALIVLLVASTGLGTTQTATAPNQTTVGVSYAVATPAENNTSTRMYGYDAQNTGHLSTVGITGNVSVQWHQQVGNRLNSVGAVHDGRVFVAVEGGPKRGSLVAVDTETGEIDWRFTKVEPHVTSNTGSPQTPAVVNGTVFLGVKGTQDPDDPFNWTGKVYAVDAESGTERWNYTASDRIDQAVTVHDGTIYVPDRSGTIYAIDAQSGTLEWKQAVPAKVSAAVAVTQESVYVTTYKGRVRALNRTTGEAQWKAKIGSNIAAAPTVQNGTVFAVSRYDNPRVVAFDAATGDRQWATRVRGQIGDQNIRGDVRAVASPAVGNGSLYVGLYEQEDTQSSPIPFNGWVLALNASSGAKQWGWEPPGEFTAEGVFNTPALVDDTLYVGAQTPRVYGIHASNGTTRWNSSILDAGTRSPPVVVNNALYIGTNDGTLLSLTGSAPTTPSTTTTVAPTTDTRPTETTGTTATPPTTTTASNPDSTDAGVSLPLLIVVVLVVLAALLLVLWRRRSSD